MKNLLKLAIAFALMIFANTAFADSKSDSQYLIKKINIVGNKRVELSTIEEYMGVKVGDIYRNETRNIVVKALYDTDLFKAVIVTFYRGTLKIRVEEMPFISSIVFDGNYKLSTKMLADTVHTAPGDTLTIWKLKKDVNRLNELYKRQARFSARVKEEVTYLDNDRAKVVFVIHEGPKTTIKKIAFVGNKSYTDSELKSIIMTRESRWFRFMEVHDGYDPDRIEFDKQKLTQFYKSVGYADFRVISATADLTKTSEGFTLVFSVDEGNKYQFGKISLKNKLKAIPDSEISGLIKNSEGKTFNMDEMEKVSEKIEKHLASKGYPHVNVTPEVVPDRANSLANVTIVVDQAAKVFVNRINIEGNLKTEDHVIRRELGLAEGDVFNRDNLDKGERNIRNLDYFDHRLSVQMSPTYKPDRYDVNIKVKEKSTASFSLQTGYNTAGGMFGRINFLERNFIGTGRYLNAGVQVGKSSIHYSGGITDPNFMDKNLSLGTSFFRSENGKGSGFVDDGGGKKKYSQYSYGGSLTLGYEIMDDLYHSLDYSLREDKLKGDEKLKQISKAISQQMGTFVTSSIAHTITLDKTDSRVHTKDGFIVDITQEYAGLGGDVKYLKHDANIKMYKSFINNKYTLKLSGSGGHIMGLYSKNNPNYNRKEVRINNRFNLGDHSLRGFAPGGIGPRLKDDSEEGLGGNQYYAFSAQMDFPLGLPKEFDLTGSVFFDAGCVWGAKSKLIPKKDYHRSKMLRTSAGFGFTWVTKIAPIRVDWGFPIHKKSYDETQAFHLKFSAQL